MYRVGIGYDVHRLVSGRPLIIGGVHIPHECGLDGHSDADVLLHAIMDAMLGAAALGDIGTHFPETDSRWQGADSGMLLAEVRSLLGENGFKLINVDVTVALERPKLRPHIAAMRKAIANILKIDVGQVSVKATTSERMGMVGREKAAAAWAICALERA